MWGNRNTVQSRRRFSRCVGSTVAPVVLGPEQAQLQCTHGFTHKPRSRASRPGSSIWWAHRDSNPGPFGCEALERAAPGIGRVRCNLESREQTAPDCGQIRGNPHKYVAGIVAVLPGGNGPPRARRRAENPIGRRAAPRHVGWGHRPVSWERGPPHRQNRALPRAIAP